VTSIKLDPRDKEVVPQSEVKAAASQSRSRSTARRRGEEVADSSAEAVVSSGPPTGTRVALTRPLFDRGP